MLLLGLLAKTVMEKWKSLENSQDFFCQDQDQDFYPETNIKTKTIFCPRGASRPRLWSRGLHHCSISSTCKCAPIYSG